VQIQKDEARQDDASILLLPNEDPDLVDDKAQQP
jgi:hypothetical protein